MASRRDLKKDINWITEEVIGDCLLFLDIHQDHDKEPVANIINTMIEKRNELVSKVNHQDKSEGRKETKEKYKSIAKDLIDTANTCFEELSKLAKKK